MAFITGDLGAQFVSAPKYSVLMHKICATECTKFCPDAQNFCPDAQNSVLMHRISLARSVTLPFFCDIFPRCAMNAHARSLAHAHYLVRASSRVCSDALARV